MSPWHRCNPADELLNKSLAPNTDEPSRELECLLRNEDSSADESDCADESDITDVTEDSTVMLICVNEERQQDFPDFEEVDDFYMGLSLDESAFTFLPASDEEHEACPKTSRQRNAQITFYTRLNELAAYKAMNGDCNVPQKYKPNKQLGYWYVLSLSESCDLVLLFSHLHLFRRVNKMREENKKFSAGKGSSLNKLRIAKLNEIGFNWGQPKGDVRWNEHYHDLVKFYELNGHSNVPTRNNRDNRKLGRFVSTQRREYKKHRAGQKSLLTPCQIRKLNAVKFRWTMSSPPECRVKKPRARL